MEPRFIKIFCRGYKLIHGFDSNQKEIEEIEAGSAWVEKIISISRIQSITEKYIRMSYSHERIIYWEYRGGLKNIQKALEHYGPVVSVGE